MIDPTAILAELAAIQRDVRTIHAAIILRSCGHSAIAADTLALSVVERIGLLMSSIAAPSPVEVDPAEAAERTKHWPACGRRKRTDARCVCDRDHDSRYAVGLPPISAESEAMASQLMAANTPAATTSRKLAVDNGMLAPIRARLDELERKVESLTKSADGYEWAVGMGHHIKALVGRHIFIDGGDPGDEQEAS